VRCRPGDNRHVADDALLEKSDFYVDEKRIDAWYSIHWCMYVENGETSFSAYHVA
jgi:hypothetical protein